jgi:hypothetical protein
MNFNPTHFNAAPSSTMLLPNNNKDEDANTDGDHGNKSVTTKQPPSENCVSKMPNLLCGTCSNDYALKD